MRSALFLALVVVALAASASLAAVEKITRNGKFLVKPDGTRFYIKGLAYQESLPTAEQTPESLGQGGYPEPTNYVDPLAQPDACSRDVKLMQDLGINTIRVYSVNSSLNHDACMKTFDDAGIYVVIDLGLPGQGSINRAAPTWDAGLLRQYLLTAEEFWNYPNTLALGVANEVVTQNNNTDALPFVRAAARDVKAFLRANGKNDLLLTYSAADAPSGPTGRRTLLAEYLACGSADERVDILGINSYSWIGQSSFQAAGYQTLVDDFASLPIPVYFSEFGGVPGNDPDARPWTEVGSIYSPPLSNVLSGGVAFTYFPKDPSSEGKDYSLTTMDGNTITPRPSFQALKTQLGGVNPPTSLANNTGGSSTIDCPAQSDAFLASTTLPPTPDDALCACGLANVFSCVANQRAQSSPDIIGSLLDYTCSALGELGQNCSGVEASGTTGTYGTWSSCNAVQRLDWAMSQFYDANNRQAEVSL